MDKVVFYIKTPGYIFLDHRDRPHRTPIRLVINKSQIEKYKSLSKRVPIAEYEILEPTEKDLEPKKNQRLSQIKPKIDVNLNFKINN